MTQNKVTEPIIDVSTIIVNYNTETLLPEAISALLKSSHAVKMQAIIVDNASKDNSIKLIREHYPEFKLIENKINVGFGRANNQALEFASGRYILLLNTDAFVSEDTVQKTVAYMDGNPKCGILGVKLIGRDGSLQPSARYFPTPWNRFLSRTGLNRLFKKTQMVDNMNWDHADIRSCDWVPGCYYLIRREVVEQVGLFDPRYFLYYEEVDHCFSAKKAGWDVVFYPSTSVIHLGGESAKSEGQITKSGRQLEALQIESEFLYFRKNLGATAACGNLFLIWLGNMIIFTKRIIKLKYPFGIYEAFAHSLLASSIFIRTRFGTVPTR
jgi:hypothetical protein